MREDRQNSIVVIGAGIVGLAIALRLQQSGEQVTLIDRADPGREASFGNVGLICSSQIFPLPSPDTLRQVPGLLFRRGGALAVLPSYLPTITPWLLRFAIASAPKSFRRGTQAIVSLQEHAISSTRSLYADAGISNLLTAGGHLLIAEMDKSLAALRKEQAMAQRYDVRCDLLGPDAVAAREPALLRPVAGALHYPDTVRVSDPYDACKGLHKAFTTAGGETLRDEVHDLQAHPNAGVELHTGAGSLKAGSVVIAAGAWSGPLVKALGYSVPLDTERGYHVMAPGCSGALNGVVAAYERKVYMNPMSGGLRTSGFAEFGGLDLPPVPARYRVLEQQARALLPGTDWPVMSEWMGFRPSLPDHLPVIGVSPTQRNVLFAFGHQHLGLTLAAVTADIVTDIAHGQSPGIDLEPFRIDRF